MCSTCVTLHCLESSISLCFSGRRAGLLEWTALHYNSTQMLPLEVWRQNSSKSLKCSVSMSLLQQFSVVGPLILLVIHLSSLSKALCLHYPRSNLACVLHYKHNIMQVSQHFKSHDALQRRFGVPRKKSHLFRSLHMTLDRLTDVEIRALLQDSLLLRTLVIWT